MTMNGRTLAFRFFKLVRFGDGGWFAKLYSIGPCPRFSWKSGGAQNSQYPERAQDEVRPR